MLVNERNPTRNNSILIDTKEVDGSKVIFMTNIRNKRTLINIAGIQQDKIRYLAIEGSTLSLMGLVKYDAEANCFKLTELSSVIAGGIDEA